MPLFNVMPEMLYPTSRQFPFDEITYKIVKALEMRNWEVPGITVEFFTYGLGEAKYKMVGKITGEDFRMFFHRKQRSLGNDYNDIAGLSELAIPREYIRVYADDSAPTYCLYVGDNWEDNKDSFMNGSNMHAKLDKKPKTYLKYNSDSGQVCPKYLQAWSDGDREYLPEGNEPKQVNLKKKFGTFVRWLQVNVLDYIQSFPEADRIEIEEPEKPIPYAGPWEIVYCSCRGESGYRIKKGLENLNALSPKDRYALSPGNRLIPYYAERKDLPKMVHNGFVWCDPNNDGHIGREKKLNWEVRDFSDTCVVALKLQYANHVYVIDQNAFDEYKRKVFEKHPKRDRLNSEERDEAYRLRAKTMVSINEYKGGYVLPLVILDREAELEEVLNLGTLEELGFLTDNG